MPFKYNNLFIIIVILNSLAWLNLALKDDLQLKLICSKNNSDCILKGYPNRYDSLIREGDIIINKDENRNAIIDDNKKWPSGIVPYVFDENFSEDSITRIEAAMRSIEKETCIKFVRYTPKVKEHQQYLRIIEGKGCHSTIGYSRVEDRIMILHQQACLGRLGKIQHELLHTLGLLHEQARPDRDNWVTVNWHSIIKGREYNFKKASASDFTTFGLAYDFRSVMHYNPYAFSKNKKTPTLIPKVDIDLNIIGQRKAATILDLKKIKLMYKC